MFYLDMSHIWNSDTEGKYPDPDPDRTARLDAIRGNRIGGFTADSLQREQVRRDYYEYVGEQQGTFSLHGISESDLRDFLSSLRSDDSQPNPSGDDVHQEIPEGSGETPHSQGSSGDPSIQGVPTPQSTIEEIRRLLKPYEHPLY